MLQGIAIRPQPSESSNLQSSTKFRNKINARRPETVHKIYENSSLKARQMSSNYSGLDHSSRNNNPDFTIHSRLSGKVGLDSLTVNTSKQQLSGQHQKQNTQLVGNLFD